jgi:hypothetical protein
MNRKTGDDAEGSHSPDRDGSPFHRVELESGEVTFVLGSDDRLDTLSNVDATVRMADGQRFGVTFLTIDEVSGILRRHMVTGESAAGSYLRIEDLIVTRRPGISFMVTALNDLIRNNEHPGSPVDPE